MHNICDSFYHYIWKRVYLNPKSLRRVLSLKVPIKRISTEKDRRNIEIIRTFHVSSFSNEREFNIMKINIFIFFGNFSVRNWITFHEPAIRNARCFSFYAEITFSLLVWNFFHSQSFWKSFVPHKKILPWSRNDLLKRTYCPRVLTNKIEFI